MQQGEGTSKELLPLEAEINPLKKQQGERAQDRSMVLHREAALRQQQAGDSKRQDSAASAGMKSRGKELQEVFRNPSRLTENLQRKADLGSSRRERRRLQGRARSWQQKQGKERRLLTEQEKPRMKPARTVCQRVGNRTSSMAGTRSCTHLPQGA